MQRGRDTATAQQKLAAQRSGGAMQQQRDTATAWHSSSRWRGGQQKMAAMEMTIAAAGGSGQRAEAGGRDKGGEDSGGKVY